MQKIKFFVVMILALFTQIANAQDVPKIAFVYISPAADPMAGHTNTSVVAKRFRTISEIALKPLFSKIHPKAWTAWIPCAK